MERKIGVLVCVLVFTWLIGCAVDPLNNQGSQTSALASLNPVPDDPDSMQSMLQRFKGQKSFLNASQHYYYPMNGTEAADSTAGKGAGREIQESDIFKVGKEGSKLLYLLNNYRGLQVISFAGGPQNPEIVGRVEATGNWPDMMYYNEQADQIIVLEKVWRDYYTYHNPNDNKYQSRILIYDVKDPVNPKITRIKEIKGTVVDSRLVGKVLYVSTSNGYWWRNNSSEQAKGFIYSLRLGTQSINQVDYLELPLTVQRDLMNIVQVDVEGQTKYYLMAISRSGDSWWARKSVVQVVDITDPEGQIKPLMSVATKGFIDERSATHIKGNTLIVTSNYRTDPNTWNSNLRIAVESFVLPSNNPTIVTEHEAKTLSSEELKGIFVRFDDTAYQGFLQKMAPDAVITVGNDQDMHARIQDIRYVDDLLYVFWVPQNQIDPFDMFDISNPAEEIKFLGRLRFEGFIQRSIPLTFQDTNYVLALGWVRPIVNNEENRRYPQVMLFKVEPDQHGNYQHQLVKKMTLQEKNAWSNFNSADKFVEVKMNGEGSGALLFQLSTYIDGRYKTGGKIVGFDLQSDQIFKEGGMLISDSGWLRRVFTNSEIDLINTFSDRALTTYDASLSATDPESVYEAISVLELARSVRGYVLLTNNYHTRGVQIIDQESPYYFWYSDQNQESKIQLRLVNKDNPDSEYSEVLHQFEIKGSLVTFKTDNTNGNLLILTKQNVSSDNDQRKVKYIFTRLAVSFSGLRLIARQSLSWEEEVNYGYSYGFRTSIGGCFPNPYSRFSAQIYQLNNGRLIIQTTDLNLSVVENGTVTKIVMDDLEDQVKSKSTIHLLGDSFYLTFEQDWKKDDASNENDSDNDSDSNIALPNGNYQFYQSFLVPLTLVENSLVASDKINIPGTIMKVMASGTHLVTLDERVLDLGESDSSYYSSMLKETNLVSLEVRNGKAVLIDALEWENGNQNSVRWMGDVLVRIEQDMQDHYNYRGYDIMPPYYPNPQPTGVARLSYIGFDLDKEFTQSVYRLNVNTRKVINLHSLFRSTTDVDKYYALLLAGKEVRVLVVDNDKSRPQVQLLQKGDSDEKEMVELPSNANSYWYYGDETQVSFDADEKAISFSQGLYGITSLKVKP